MQQLENLIITTIKKGGKTFAPSPLIKSLYTFYFFFNVTIIYTGK